MKRHTVYITIALLTFVIGITAAWFYRFNHAPVRSPPNSLTFESSQEKVRRFFYTGDSCGTGFCIHNYESSDGIEVVVSGSDTTAPKYAKRHYLSNLAAAKETIERTIVLDEHEKRVGERAVVAFATDEVEQYRIVWTNGSEFWLISSLSLQHALEFEKTELTRLPSLSNQSLHLTAVRLGLSGEQKRSESPALTEVCSVPQTETKLEALEALLLAECFVTSNGYTDLPLMADTTNLSWEGVDWADPKQRLEYRYNTLERRAYGVIRGSRTKDGWSVVFRYNRNNPKFQSDKYVFDKYIDSFGRVVSMDVAGGNIHVEHIDFRLSDFTKVKENIALYRQPPPNKALQLTAR